MTAQNRAPRHGPRRPISQLKTYPPEAVGNPKRMEEWDNPHDKSGRIKTSGFRPATVEAYREVLRFKWKVKDLGSDICFLYCSYAQSFNAFQDGLETKDPKALLGANVINFQQNNQFNYMPQVPRREPDRGLLQSSKRGISGTTYRRAMEAYVQLEALRMPPSFCFRDFLEISPNQFRKIILRLKRRGLIEPIEPRTYPRFYRLTPKFLIPLTKEHGYKMSALLHEISEFNHGAPEEGAL